jgi:4-aminobutyrate aminotransferase-like enzyme
MAVFTCTGSEANELALRMARMITGKEGIICTNNTYHGNTAAVDELSTTFTHGRTGSARVRAVTFPETYRPLGDLEGAALLDAYLADVRAAIGDLDRGGFGLAGMLVCPIFANEGLPDVPAGYLERAAQLVREAGGLVIFDEVQAGFGRTGHYWGHQLPGGTTPDIATLGKPMGNGYPIAGVVSRAEIVNAFRERVMYFNTFGGNPVACAAALAVLDVIEDEQLIERVRRVAAYTTRGLHKLMATHAQIGDVRSKGTFWAVELVKDRAAKTPAPELANAVVNSMRRRGVLLSRQGTHNNVLKIRPPLQFGSEHADVLLEVLERGIEESVGD